LRTNARIPPEPLALVFNGPVLSDVMNQIGERAARGGFRLFSRMGERLVG
jgi:hypothetical protein